MQRADFIALSELTLACTGVTLDPKASFSVENRLQAIALHNDMDTLGALLDAATREPGGALAEEIIAAVLPADTQFFRDKAVFERVEGLLVAEFRSARPRDLRILSAGCGAGQEAYSLALIAERVAAAHDRETPEIVALDVNAKALERARQGLFSHYEVQRGLAVRTLLKHFEPDAEQWRIAARLRAMIDFRCVNLLDDLSALGEFDVILCRNVVRDMDSDARDDVLERLAELGREEAHVILGRGESPSEFTDALRAEPDQLCIYRTPKTPEGALVRG